MGLTAVERNQLLTAVEMRLREFEGLAAAKRAEEEQQKTEEILKQADPGVKRGGRVKVAQVIGGAGAFQVTPVVSGDRRFVRIGVNGTFTTMTAGVPFVGPGFTMLGLNTTVNAPAGGSIVVGGYQSAVSMRQESGVPIIGHIPYVGRLFNNVGYGSASNSVQVQIRATPFSFYP